MDEVYVFNIDITETDANNIKDVLNGTRSADVIYNVLQKVLNQMEIKKASDGDFYLQKYHHGYGRGF